MVNKSPDDSKNMPVADIEDNEVVDDDDKSQLRARNRKAAAKFRVRKKGDARKLREREEASRELNRILTHEVGKLREECLMLKNMVLDYARCGCPPIDDYIQNAAAGAWKASNPSNKNVGPLVEFESSSVGASAIIDVAKSLIRSYGITMPGLPGEE